jgi:hypothetical protein
VIPLIILGLLGLCGILVWVCRAQSERAAEAERETASLRDTLMEAQHTAFRLQKALEKQTEAEVTAHAERQELAGTADSDLVHRANNLFGGGVQDKPGNAGGN